MSETHIEAHSATTNELLAAARQGDQEKVKALIAGGNTDLLRDALQGFLGLVRSATTPEAREEALLVGVALGIMQVEDAPTEPLPEIQTLNDEATQQGEEAVLPRIREYLEKHPEAVNDVWPNFKVTPLIAAACSGLTQTVKLLLELGADTTATNSLGETAAQRCRKLGYIEIADTIEQYTKCKDCATTGDGQVNKMLFEQCAKCKAPLCTGCRVVWPDPMTTEHWAEWWNVCLDCYKKMKQ